MEPTEYTPDLLHSISRSFIHKLILSPDDFETVDLFKVYFKKLRAYMPNGNNQSSSSKTKESTNTAVLEMILEVLNLSTNLIYKFVNQQNINEWVDHVSQIWEDIIICCGSDSEISCNAYIGLGNLYLARADIEIEKSENEEESSSQSPHSPDNNFIITTLQNSVSNFKKALSLDSELTSAQVKLGETYVNLGNALDIDDEAEPENSIKYYKLAVECFKVVVKHDINELPNQFQEFLEDWEGDFME